MEICFFLILYDGNFGVIFFNVLDNGEFERVKNLVDCKFIWFINVIYFDDFNFIRIDVNVVVVIEL